MRSAWIEKRKGQANVSQMHYARQGLITEEMAHVAQREKLPASLVMEELAGLAEDYSSDRSKARRARGLGGLGFKLKDTKRLNFSEAWAGFGLE